MFDVIIIGAGPVGLACAIEAKAAGLSSLVIEKGALVNSIVGYPARMEFFSTPDIIEIGGYTFPVQAYKPSREEAIAYYRAVAAREHMDVNLLNVPGEDLPKVTHYYREPYPDVRQHVAVIGAKNSAAKAALDCHRHGAKVTLIVRGPALSDRIKYWIKPDLENRIKEGSIRAFFNTTVASIAPTTLTLNTPGGTEQIENDWVLAMTGYHPDYSFLEALEIPVADDRYRTPIFNETTFESARPGVYLAGTVCGGYQTGRWFIENGRFHARQIAQHIKSGTAEPVPFDAIHWKT